MKTRIIIKPDIAWQVGYVVLFIYPMSTMLIYLPVCLDGFFSIYRRINCPPMLRLHEVGVEIPELDQQILQRKSVFLITSEGIQIVAAIAKSRQHNSAHSLDCTA